MAVSASRHRGTQTHRESGHELTDLAKIHSAPGGMSFSFERNKGRFCKRGVLANVPSFRLVGWRKIKKHSFLLPGWHCRERLCGGHFGTGEHLPKPHFWKPPFGNHPFANLRLLAVAPSNVLKEQRDKLDEITKGGQRVNSRPGVCVASCLSLVC